MLVPTPTPLTQFAPYYQGKTSNYSTDPGKYLYTVLANGSEKMVQLGTVEGGELTTRWTIEYQASYKKEVYEKGLSLTVVEHYKTYANNPQASGNYATQILTLEPISSFYLGEIVDGSRSSGPFWIENGDINTWVIVQIILYGNEQISKNYNYWFTK